jgi:hypothetical protein
MTVLTALLQIIYKDLTDPSSARILITLPFLNRNDNTINHKFLMAGCRPCQSSSRYCRVLIRINISNVRTKAVCHDSAVNCS